MRALLISGLLLLGCATQTHATMTAEEAFRSDGPAEAPPPGPAPGTRAWAEQFRRSFDCEQAARDEKANADLGWHALQACVRRGDFTHLELLVRYWREDLQRRHDAPELMARVIAARGGFAKEDIQLLRDSGVLVFDLRSALLQPQAFQGKLVLFVAQADSSEGRDLLLVEERPTTTVQTIAPPNGRTVLQQRDTGARVGFRTSGFLGSGTASMGVSRQTLSGVAEQRLDFGFAETGTLIVARMDQPDLNITAERPEVFVALFEGARPPSDTQFVVSEATAGKSLPTPVVKLVAHHVVR